MDRTEGITSPPDFTPPIPSLHSLLASNLAANPVRITADSLAAPAASRISQAVPPAYSSEAPSLFSSGHPVLERLARVRHYHQGFMAATAAAASGNNTAWRGPLGNNRAPVHGSSPISLSMASPSASSGLSGSSYGSVNTSSQEIPAGVTLNMPYATRRASARAAAAACTDPESQVAASLDSSETSPKSSGRERKRRSSPITTDGASHPKKRRKAATRKAPPNLKKESDADEKPSEEQVSCCICMCEPERTELSGVDGCEHQFCFSCIGKWAERENTCPLCKSRFSKISRVHPQRKRKNGPAVSNVKKVKQRDQRADIVSGPALESLLANITASGLGNSARIGRLIFARMGSNAPRFSFAVEDGRLDSDDDDDFVPHFMDAFMRGGLQIGRARTNPTLDSFFGATAATIAPSAAAALSQASVPAAATSAWAQASRSYATNGSDQFAGRAAENPLEIDDDSDDDGVEVIQVTRAA